MLRGWGWVVVTLGGASALALWLHGIDLAAEARRTGGGQFRSSWTQMQGWVYPHPDATGRVVLELSGAAATPTRGSEGRRGVHVVVDRPEARLREGLDALALVPEDHLEPLIATARSAVVLAEPGDAASARFTGGVRARQGGLAIATGELSFELPSRRELDAWASAHWGWLGERVAALDDAGARAALASALAAIEARDAEPRDRVDAVAAEPRFAALLGWRAALDADPRRHARIDAPGPVTLARADPDLRLAAAGLEATATDGRLRLRPPVDVEVDAAVLLGESTAALAAAIDDGAPPGAPPADDPRAATGGAPAPSAPPGSSEERERERAARPGHDAPVRAGDRIRIRSEAPVWLRALDRPAASASASATTTAADTATATATASTTAGAARLDRPRAVELRFEGQAEIEVTLAADPLDPARDLRPLGFDLLEGGVLVFAVSPRAAKDGGEEGTDRPPSPPVDGAPRAAPAAGAAASSGAPGAAGSASARSAASAASRARIEDLDLAVERGVIVRRGEDVLGEARALRWRGADGRLALAGTDDRPAWLIVEDAALASAAAEAEGEVRRALEQSWRIEGARIEVVLGAVPPAAAPNAPGVPAAATSTPAEAPKRGVLRFEAWAGPAGPARLASQPAPLVAGDLAAASSATSSAPSAPAPAAAAGAPAARPPLARHALVEGGHIVFERPREGDETVTVEPLGAEHGRQRLERPLADDEGRVVAREVAEVGRAVFARARGRLEAAGGVWLERVGEDRERILSAGGERLVVTTVEEPREAEPSTASSTPAARLRPEALTLEGPEVEVVLVPDRLDRGDGDVRGERAERRGASPPAAARGGAPGAPAEATDSPPPPVKLLGTRIDARFERRLEPARAGGEAPRGRLRVAEATASAAGSPSGLVRVVPAIDLPPEDRFELRGAHLVYRAARGGEVVVEGAPGGPPPTFTQGEPAGAGALSRLTAPRARLDLFTWEVRLTGGLEVTLRPAAKPARDGRPPPPVVPTRLRAPAATIAIDPPGARAAAGAPQGPLGRVAAFEAEGPLVYEGPRALPGGPPGAADRIDAARATYDRASGALILDGDPIRTASGQTLRRLVIRLGEPR